jgi:hypothetical protein
MDDLLSSTIDAFAADGDTHPAMLRDQVKAVVKPWRLEDVLAAFGRRG